MDDVEFAHADQPTPCGCPWEYHTQDCPVVPDPCSGVANALHDEFSYLDIDVFELVPRVAVPA